MILGRARPRDRTAAASAAHRSRTVSATSQSPWTVRDRTRLRPLTRSGPSATRTSIPRVDASAATRYLAHVSCSRVRNPASRPRTATNQLLGYMLGYDHENNRNQERHGQRCNRFGGAPGWVRTPNLAACAPSTASGVRPPRGRRGPRVHQLRRADQVGAVGVQGDAAYLPETRGGGCRSRPRWRWYQRRTRPPWRWAGRSCRRRSRTG